MGDSPEFIAVCPYCSRAGVCKPFVRRGFIACEVVGVGRYLALDFSVDKSNVHLTLNERDWFRA